jgi:hypothetical protein
MSRVDNFGPVDAALRQAVLADNLAAARAAIEQGADVNSRNWAEHRPLHLAVSYAGMPVLELLLENDADPNLDDGHGMTPLHEAVATSKFDLAEALLKAGADINIQRDKRVTPLHSAFFQDMRSREQGRVAFLIKNGADPSVTMLKDGREQTVADLARAALAKSPYAAEVLKILGIPAATPAPEADKEAAGERKMTFVRPTREQRNRYRL